MRLGANHFYAEVGVYKFHGETVRALHRSSIRLNDNSTVISPDERGDLAHRMRVLLRKARPVKLPVAVKAPPVLRHPTNSSPAPLLYLVELAMRRRSAPNIFVGPKAVLVAERGIVDEPPIAPREFTSSMDYHWHLLHERVAPYQLSENLVRDAPLRSPIPSEILELIGRQLAKPDALDLATPDRLAARPIDVRPQPGSNSLALAQHWAFFWLLSRAIVDQAELAKQGLMSDRMQIRPLIPSPMAIGRIALIDSLIRVRQ